MKYSFVVIDEDKINEFWYEHEGWVFPAETNDKRYTVCFIHERCLDKFRGIEYEYKDWKFMKTYCIRCREPMPMNIKLEFFRRLI